MRETSSRSISLERRFGVGPKGERPGARAERVDTLRRFRARDQHPVGDPVRLDRCSTFHSPGLETGPTLRTVSGTT